MLNSSKVFYSVRGIVSRRSWCGEVIKNAVNHEPHIHSENMRRVQFMIHGSWFPRHSFSFVNVRILCTTPEVESGDYGCPLGEFVECCGDSAYAN